MCLSSEIMLCRERSSKHKSTHTSWNTCFLPFWKQFSIDYITRYWLNVCLVVIHFFSNRMAKTTHSACRARRWWWKWSEKPPDRFGHKTIISIQHFSEFALNINALGDGQSKLRGLTIWFESLSNRLAVLVFNLAMTNQWHWKPLCLFFPLNVKCYATKCLRPILMIYRRLRQSVLEITHISVAKDTLAAVVLHSLIGLRCSSNEKLITVIALKVLI